MPYTVSLDGIQMPVTPSKIETKIKNQNKTINLMDGSEVNILKAPGLTEISFELLIPQVWYPFSVYSAEKKENDNDGDGMVQGKEFLPASYYLDLFDRLKREKTKFQFEIKRTSPDGSVKLFDTFKDMFVSLEEYSIIEDSGNGLDLTVSMNLKQYREYSTRVCTIDEKNNISEGQRQPPKNIPKSYTVKKGDTLWAICRKYLHDGSKYSAIAKLNGIKNPNMIYPGQVIRLG